eukprot:CAMPEP_0204837708 /NCGR_PEP_ID=MMETSP1346-20131115/28730_1 /ASSEMBLY_ACC=CAM_ASM_000771 /TAXON_ID=215587 /ORGANISM="Aplanochytrium stocchinoi, Strain GSBS06" /LENGTH=328 /DNA_ID=CAMNT_0051973327 /DNA_START=288 /DNA_END=1274 /DNA_ORIENTATION=+
MEKLEDEVNRQAIICLQEVSALWEGRLHRFFSSNEYYYIHSGYGSKYSDYMGVGIAFSLKKFRLLNSNAHIVADTKKFEPRSKSQSQSRPAGNPIPFMYKAVSEKLSSIIFEESDEEKRKREVAQCWKDVLVRRNKLLTLHLEDISTNKKFLVATCHMPMHENNKNEYMIITTALTTQYLQDLARKWAQEAKVESLPFVFAGDFNFTQYEPAYELITKGDLVSDESKKYLPGKLYETDPWIHKVEPLRSAYVQVQEVEPDFTTYLKQGGIGLNESFIETIDYLFYHGENLKPVEVDKMIGRESVRVKSFPSSTEPSDHLKIGGSFELQ